jgi:hypothetical protein
MWTNWVHKAEYSVNDVKYEVEWDSENFAKEKINYRYKGIVTSNNPHAKWCVIF